ncbi:MAG: hypothetical protein ACOYMA_22905 [Bacteroidia bacterium]
MKKTMFFALVLFFFSGCYTPPHFYSLKSNIISYAKYSDKGFFITESNSVNFEYVTIGNITTESTTGYVDKNNKIVDSKDRRYDSAVNYRVANLEDAFEKLFEDALKAGANGVINVKMNYISTSGSGYITYPSKWMLTGMLIKR